MEYKGKTVMEENPTAGDSYRQNYADGIQSFLERMKDESARQRRAFMPPEKLRENPEKYRAEYKKMLGLDRLNPFSSRPAQRIRVGRDDMADIERLTLYLEEDIPFYSMLFIPHGARNAPLVIAQHGGGGTPELCADMNGKNNYNHMVYRLLEKGAVVIAPQLLLWSQEESVTHRKHPVPYDRRKTDLELKRYGLSVTALEIAGISKCVDYGCGLEEVNGEKVAMIGLSYGGYFTLHAMAADTRIRAGYAAGCFNDRDRYPWQDFTYPSSALKFHDAETAALCAPRKLFVQIGKADPVFDYRGALSESERVYDYYRAFGCEENFRFCLWEGGHILSDDDEGFDFILN